MPDLNRRQQQAVEHIDSPLLVLAGAGSGKTRVITNKIAYLIQQCGHKAHTIASVTFTNKAAREMKERVTQIIPKAQTRGLRVSTFHTLGLNIIKSELKLLGLKSGFSIFDTHDSHALLKDLMRQLGFNSSSQPDEEFIKEYFESIARQISSWKNDCITPEQLAKQSSVDPAFAYSVKVYEQYNHHLRTYNAVDFDDLIMLPVLVFSQNPAILEKWQNRIRYLLVDEYQDTNTTQYQLVKLLVGDRTSLTVVGDDDQSIYCWRGAKPENLALLEKDFPQLKVIKLEQNYRSTKIILKAANTLIANNSHVFEKALWSELGNGEPIKIMRVPDEHKEAERVVSALVAHHFRFKKSYGDYAILYRGNHQSRLFEKQLREQQVPYFLSGSTSFFSYIEVRDMLSYLRLLVNPADDNAFLRIINTPRRQIGSATIEKLSQYCTQSNTGLLAGCAHLALNEYLPEKAVQRLNEFSNWMQRLQKSAYEGNPIKTVEQLIVDIDYDTWLFETSNNEKQAEKRIENVNELVEWLKRLHDNEPESTLDDLVSKMILLDIMDRNEEDSEGNQVALMTMHASKGLEFPYVYIVGMEEELLPHRTSIEEDNIEEERRLCYVGITRAQKELTFSLTSKRRQYGEMIDCVPSRFLDELPEEDLQWLQGKQRLEADERKALGRSSIAGIRDILG
ncbi:MAG: DNA helicase Rep [gamma proteobacterium symbiont of Bathyaustriella thionipta]|nr:DNA helicase Rep [gamma proteobacterium symbiont of Bathyaustriella thionipta]MCU7950976.1 DNA helicase Rep [gamma proteobacterium symbiont of Bathyaustriella thionipta]MCU7952176.1 DNA helicase Rep [gamma proteobacterium symbiont of Bathyaustriella thionipta]MCU7957474.1 DNA helicase Rep [gamma proteobacterium symbiont of Bathyaustriella thionipta]MCU7967434.1 DNA helicase Rep [gamma proteobacterium symbiont of Bathyaustriella thionipta]